MNLDLSIIIVNWNTAAQLKNCLASISSEAEIIVVDNASTDESAVMVVSDFPRVRLRINRGNYGFARANNQGWRASAHEFVLFLNSDTIVPSGVLMQLVEFMREHPDVGACGPRLARVDSSTQPFAFGGDPTPVYLLRRAFTRLVLRRSLHDWETREPQSVDWISGACLLARRVALEQVGGFDEKFFMYFEDNDLCLRIRRAGWKIFYAPHVAITHLGGASLGQSQTRNKFYDASLRYFYAKHYSPLAHAILELLLPFYRRIA